MKEKIYLGGTFDLFHPGHINLFKEARKIAPIVCVSLNTDEFNLKYKGKKPYMNLAERMETVASCRYVDEVVVNTGGTDSKPAIIKAAPQYILHGSDWKGDSLMIQMGLTKEFLKEEGIKMVTVPYTKGVSTTELINQIKCGPKVIAVDLDKTLCQGEAWTPEDCLTMVPIKENIEIVNQLYKKNFIVIYTARRDHMILNTLTWLKLNGIMFQSISNNKMSADYYIDDKAIEFEALKNKLNVKNR